MARKRKRGAQASSSTAKRARIQASSPVPCAVVAAAARTPLPVYYDRIVSLRTWLLHRLPRSSRTRRCKLAAVPCWSHDVEDSRAQDGQTCADETAERRISYLKQEGQRKDYGERDHGDTGDDSCRPKENGQLAMEKLPDGRREQQLARLLDGTLVCEIIPKEQGSTDEDDEAKEKEREQLQQSWKSTAASNTSDHRACQSELVDFVVRHLFYTAHRHIPRPAHMLCRGLRRPVDSSRGVNVLELDDLTPGTNMMTVKSGPWCDLLRLLGKHGDEIMLDLLLHPAIFTQVLAGRDNFLQLSGLPISETPSRQMRMSSGAMSSEISPGQRHAPAEAGIKHSLAQINFVRSRMMYARAALNARGDVSLGLRHIHAFNRYPDPCNLEHTITLLKYIFPRQFRLHNVFTSKVDPRETTHAFKDYTLREGEMKERAARDRQRMKHDRTLKVPKRLRGNAILLVQQLQKLHSRCSYVEFLRHYCPEGPSAHNQETGGSLIDASTPHHQVSAFVRAVVRRVFPRELWGNEQNAKVILQAVDDFVRCRRFESLNLHSILQRIQISQIPWLAAPELQGRACSLTDTNKRREIMAELIYYLLDSFVIPLTRSNFHVTESTTHKNQLFYFRHDMWRQITEPSFTRLKSNLYAELPTRAAQRILKSRKLGFSQVRLVPKGAGVRPITNLRKRMVLRQNGQKVLALAINQYLRSTQSVLNLQRHRRPDKLGASLFCVDDIYPHLANFRKSLAVDNGIGQRLYFAKVDVQSCFDTIPQLAVLQLIEELCDEDEYAVTRYTELRLAQPPKRGLDRLQSKRSSSAALQPKLQRKFRTSAQTAESADGLLDGLEKHWGVEKQQTIFVDAGSAYTEDRDRLMQLLRQHVQQNLVRMGKKFYRQRAGIPQGSVVSSLLCNFFYAAFEHQHLSFIDPATSLLLRLTDDFLLVTTDQGIAHRFVEVMHKGSPEFGISVQASKSLVNFPCQLPNGQRLATVDEGSGFPYCGAAIDMHTLAVRRDWSRVTDAHLGDALTVDRKQGLGQTFYHKTMTALKVQLRAMYLDTAFNSTTTVLQTLWASFRETALKMTQYLRSLEKHLTINDGLIIRTIEHLADPALALARSKQRSSRHPGFRCAISAVTMQWLCYSAVDQVLATRPARYGLIRVWLQGACRRLREHRRLDKRCLLSGHGPV